MLPVLKGLLSCFWSPVQDVAAPLYASILVEAAQRLGPSPAFYALWPSAELAHPWSQLAARLYTEVALHVYPSTPMLAKLNCHVGLRSRQQENVEAWLGMQLAAGCGAACGLGGLPGRRVAGALGGAAAGRGVRRQRTPGGGARAGGHAAGDGAAARPAGYLAARHAQRVRRGAGGRARAPQGQGRAPGAHAAARRGAPAGALCILHLRSSQRPYKSAFSGLGIMHPLHLWQGKIKQGDTMIAVIALVHKCADRQWHLH